MEAKARSEQAAKDAFRRVGLNWIVKPALDSGAFKVDGLSGLHSVYRSSFYEVAKYLSMRNATNQ